MKDAKIETRATQISNIRFIEKKKKGESGGKRRLLNLLAVEIFSLSTMLIKYFAFYTFRYSMKTCNHTKFKCIPEDTIKAKQFTTV